MTPCFFMVSSAYIFTYTIMCLGNEHSWAHYILFPVSAPMRYGVICFLVQMITTVFSYVFRYKKSTCF